MYFTLGVPCFTPRVSYFTLLALKYWDTFKEKVNTIICTVTNKETIKLSSFGEKIWKSVEKCECCEAWMVKQMLSWKPPLFVSKWRHKHIIKCAKLNKWCLKQYLIAVYLQICSVVHIFSSSIYKQRIPLKRQFYLCIIKMKYLIRYSKWRRQGSEL